MVNYAGTYKRTSEEKYEEFLTKLGVGYLMVAWDPVAHRGIVWIGGATKLAGGLMSWRAIATGQMPAETWWQAIVTDWVWLVGFVVFLATTRGSED